MNDLWDVIVVGAGPVGLFLANLLDQRGLKTLVLEKREAKPETSRAIGIMPPSLELLETIQLADKAVHGGVRVTKAVVHGSRQKLGTVDFSGLPGNFPFLLSIPAHRTEAILADRLGGCAEVRLQTGAEVCEISQAPDQVTVKWQDRTTNDSHTARARFAVACDGATSTVRQMLPIQRKSQNFPQTFLMADFADCTQMGSEAHLFFTHLGAVESFPLPEGQRRWVVQTKSLEREPSPAFLEQTVETRTGQRLDPADRVWQSPFGIERHLCERYWDGRVVLCGDAAHVMPPIGGQGMNTGFADAWLLAETLHQIPGQDSSYAAAFEEYTRRRKIAAWAAMQRAELSMKIGTASGRFRSTVRNGLVYAALHTSAKSRLSPRFAMRTIPYGTLEQLTS